MKGTAGLRVGLATVLGVALTAAAPAQATFPGANGRIAFSSDRSGDFEIYTMNADGSDLERLTKEDGADAAPRWSPDGRRIVFHHTRDGASQIYVMNADGSAQTRLTDSVAAFDPSWSSDGGRIAFSAYAGQTRTEIWVMNADGSDLHRITDTPRPFSTFGGTANFPRWSTDDHIAFSSLRKGVLSTQIFVMAGDGTNLRQVTNDEVSNFRPDWSPDDTRLLFFSDRDNDYDVFVVNADGSGETQLTNSPGDDFAGGWAPDGTKIVFSSARDGGNPELYTMNPDGSAPTRLTYDPGTDFGPDWQSVKPPPVPPAPLRLPPPKLGETVNVSRVSGTVLLRARRSSALSTLAQPRQIGVGSHVDAKRGVVRLVSAASRHGSTQSGDFSGGVFAVTQPKSAKPTGRTDIGLRGGSFRSCKPGSRKTIRSLRANAKGRFRTTGRYGAASGRGATWRTTDRCDGTLTSVNSGVVSVFDFKRKRTVTVRAGKSYLARATR
jgi:Tol biopolymer transport system component